LIVVGWRRAANNRTHDDQQPATADDSGDGVLVTGDGRREFAADTSRDDGEEELEASLQKKRGRLARR